jgi:NAD-dependent deacetylase
MNDLFKKAAKAIAAASHTIALTGAGISVESGIPPFRGRNGLWEKIDPMEFAHIDAFMKDPAKVWRVLISELKGALDGAMPNPAHTGLRDLEKLGLLKMVITQNIDGLHQRAGNTNVIEFHGNFAWQRCLDCNGKCETAKIDLKKIPPRCHCGGIYRPECIFFGEMIPPEHLSRSREAAAKCDLMLVMGTSAVVQPSAQIPVIAKENGATIIEINPESTPLTGSVSDFLIKERAGMAMERIISELKTLTGL